ncbi:MAG TPA: efflux RND transporter periplasmic adaptor subunit [Acidobacteriota bacterium]|nr:efflux RND transporter periplasmic adaptor subunit [Acidobacteriota bacterium]
MTRKTFPLPTILSIAFLLAGCQSDYTTSAASQKKRVQDPAVRKVRVVLTSLEKVARPVEVSGTLAAEDQVTLGMKVAGRLAEISVDLGSHVRKGQPIARLDPTDYRLHVQQANTALQQARARLGLPADGKSDYVDPEKTALVRQAAAVLHDANLTRDRMSRLYEQKLVPRAQLDDAIATLQVAEGKYQDAIEEVRNRQAILAQRKSELEIARQQLADTVLYSPLDGMARERQTSVGTYLVAGAPVVTLVRIHPLRLRLPVPEREAGGVRIGQLVRVGVEGDPNSYMGRVARLSPAISEGNRTLLIEAEVPNESGRLRPGAFAKAEILTEAEKPSIFVPASSIVTFAGIEKVITVRDNRTVEKRVQTGRRESDQVEIINGLTPGETVVVQPGNLVGGQPVTVSR